MSAGALTRAPKPTTVSPHLFTNILLHALASAADLRGEFGEAGQNEKEYGMESGGSSRDVDSRHVTLEKDGGMANVSLSWHVMDHL